jgi:hypothetical protein
MSVVALVTAVSLSTVRVGGAQQEVGGTSVSGLNRCLRPTV